MTLHQFSAGGALTGAAPGDLVTVEGQEAKHALAVHRLGTGDLLRLADGAGRVAEAAVHASSDRGKAPVLVAEIRSVQDAPQPQPGLHLVQALAKNERDLAAVEMATELGVLSVTPWEAERSIAKWPSAKADKSAQKWQNVLDAAAKQSRNPWTPVLEPLVTTRQLAARIREITAEGGVVVVLHESGQESLAAQLQGLPAETQIHLVVGPEGGISPREAEMFAESGARIAALGALILRASTAGPVAMVTAQAILSSSHAGKSAPSA